MTRAALVLIVLGLVASPALASAVAAPHVSVELVAEAASLAPGSTTRVGLRLTPADEWHVYWRNPGDSGEAPSVGWTLPSGFSIEELEWPAPRRLATGPLVNFGYVGPTLLAARLHVPTDVAVGSRVEIAARAKWLVCNADECVPGSAPLALTLPVDTGAPRPTSAAALFADAHAHVPIAPPAAWRITATTSPDALAVDVRGPGAAAAARGGAPAFFPFGREVIDHAAPQRLALDDDGFTLALVPWSGATAPPDRLAGVLTVGGAAYEIAAATTPASPERHDAAAPGWAAALRAIGLAFLGGVVLNLMPCVFPVLALKALALVGLAREGRRTARLHGAVYALGVVVSFWSLAAVLLAARAGGARLGWGFHLQSPIAVALLATLFFWMALTLLGVSTVGASLMGVGDRLTRGGGYRGAFYTGVLATVVATPCTAPFMGAALGYALVQPAAIALAVFTALGVGLALPYVALTIVPGLGRRLPRPGRWMETLEQLLAFPLLATVVWLVWVASLQAGPNAVPAMLVALLLVALAAWMARRWRAGVARALAAALVVVAIAIDASLAPVAERPGGEHAALGWEPYSRVRVDELLRAGTPVFIDFTAAWCVTCQVNERVALAVPAVTERMRALGVVPLRADWTRPNAEIASALQAFGREGVPLYVLYSGRKEDPPRILPQVLTTETVLTELAELDTRSRT